MSLKLEKLNVFFPHDIFKFFISSPWSNNCVTSILDASRMTSNKFGITISSQVSKLNLIIFINNWHLNECKNLVKRREKESIHSLIVAATFHDKFTTWNVKKEVCSVWNCTKQPALANGHANSIWTTNEYHSMENQVKSNYTWAFSDCWELMDWSQFIDTENPLNSPI